MNNTQLCWLLIYTIVMWLYNGISNLKIAIVSQARTIYK
jgi:hypothetical protein